MVRFFRKLLGSLYSAIIGLEIELPAWSIFFHQPSISLPYTYIETLHGDISFTFEERDAILKAAQAWEYFSNGLFKIRITFDYEPTLEQDLGEDGIIVRASADHEEIARADGYHKMECWGLCVYRYSGVRDLFLVAERIGKNMRDFRSTAMHEMGHYLWLPHIAESGVMHPHRYDVLFPTEADAKLYAKHYGFRTDDFRYFIRL